MYAVMAAVDHTLVSTAGSSFLLTTIVHCDENKKSNQMNLDRPHFEFLTVKLGHF